MNKGAYLSPCASYRYALWRIWNEDLPLLTFVMLNPSTADASADDKTVNRCMRFAGSNRFGGIVVVNLFAYRATEPKDMKQAADPVGPDNDKWLRWVAQYSHTVLLAWGADGDFLNRDRVAVDLFLNPKCLGKTKSGLPRHPLFVKADTQFQPFN